MAEKPRSISVYPSPGLRSHLDERNGTSQRINEIFERYEAIVLMCCLELEPDERRALTEYLTGKTITPVLVANLAKEIMASPAYLQGEESAVRLFLKLKSADYPTLMATVDRAGF